MPLETYEFDDDSYTATANAGVNVPAVLAVLHGHPVHRQHIGTTGLIITGRAPDGQIISVGLLEIPGRDDTYRVAQVHVLPPAQAAAFEHRMGGE
ncbi:hypothetical protein EV385_6666 [Krasilnikovia cinnamomea]|uniref:Uncharacterized protein n=1 Tax=Krasilnikovia cinnamomea TaxID=349313 RepID=A0A4Q7Z959_9ACTN|nr:hypothetical protein [Krasilnikovia cinnamomea]RZU46591.1 hypothetical protein EV385_6666 [Krasilnikovia cinnamomea]